MCYPKVASPVKDYPGVGSCPGCMSEGKTHFISLLNLYKREWLFYVEVFMAQVWIVVFFIVKAVAVCGVFQSRKGAALSKCLSVNIFELGAISKF